MDTAATIVLLLAEGKRPAEKKSGKSKNFFIYFFSLIF